MPFVQNPEVLLERYIALLSEYAQVASIPEIKAVLIGAHDKLCALRKPGMKDEAV